VSKSVALVVRAGRTDREPSDSVPLAFDQRERLELAARSPRPYDESGRIDLEDRFHVPSSNGDGHRPGPPGRRVRFRIGYRGLGVFPAVGRHLIERGIERSARGAFIVDLGPSAQYRAGDRALAGANGHFVASSDPRRDERRDRDGALAAAGTRREASGRRCRDDRRPGLFVHGDVDVREVVIRSQPFFDPGLELREGKIGREFPRAGFERLSEGGRQRWVAFHVADLPGGADRHLTDRADEFDDIGRVFAVEGG